MSAAPPAAAAKKTTAAAAKKTPAAAAVATMSPPPQKIALFSLDTRDAAIVAYYNDEGVDYAEVEIHVNGVVPLGTYRFALAEDGMSITWQRGIDKVCLNKDRLRGVMRDKFSSSSSRVVAYCDATQEMHRNKVSPDAGGQYWGAPQVIRLREKCTGTPTDAIYPYPTKTKVDGHRQYNTLAHCRVQLALKHYSNAAPTHYRTIDLFGIQSSQESHDDPDSPPPPKKRRHKKHASPPPRLAPRRSVVSEGRGERYDYDSVREYDGCL
jgi:hypothetical protein